MKKDYPAAHSNDTDWFAVDEDGNIALFDARADGASPSYYGEDSFLDSWYDLTTEEKVLIFECDFPIGEFPELLNKPKEFKSVTESGMYGELNRPENSGFSLGEEEIEDVEFNFDDDYEYDVYLFLISDSKVIPSLAPGVSALYFPEVSETDYGLVIIPVTNAAGYGEVINQLIQEGKICGFAGVDPTIYFLFILRSLPVHRFEPEKGGFTYPYKAINNLDKVLNVNDVTPSFPFATERLKTNFSETTRVQLMEIGYSYDDIYTWNSAGWVALDGKVYDFEGNFLGMEKDL